MTREEALSMIIDALDDVEEFDEALDVLRTSESDGEDATTWKQKYDDLAEKYKKRFKDEIMSQPSQALEKPGEATIPEKPVPIEKMDFSAETE